MAVIFNPEIPLWGLYPQVRNGEKKGPSPAMMQRVTQGRAACRAVEERGGAPRGAGGPGSNSGAASPASVSLFIKGGLDPHCKCVQGGWLTGPIPGWGAPSGPHGLGRESGSGPVLGPQWARERQP